MTGWGSIDTAVEAMRRGARSFVQKPWEDVTLLEILQREIAEARAARRRDHHQQRELEDARLIQRGLLPTVVPQRRRHRSRRRLAAGEGVGGDCFDTLTFGRSRRGVDCRHRRQGPARRAADVEPAGRGPRLRAGSRRALVGVRERQPAALPQHGERPVRHLLLRPHRARRGQRRLLERRPQSAAARARRRHDRAALARRDGARHLPRQRLRTGRARGRARRSPRVLHRRHHRSARRRTGKSTARSG